MAATPLAAIASARRRSIESGMYFGAPGPTFPTPANPVLGSPLRPGSTSLRARRQSLLLLPTLPPESEIVRSTDVKVKRERSTQQWHSRKLVLTSKEIVFSRVHGCDVLDQVPSCSVGTSSDQNVLISQSQSSSPAGGGLGFRV